MKKLIFIPIAHSFSDMGSMKEVLREVGIKKLGKKKWEENQKKIKRFWNEVEKAIDKLNLDYKKVRIYQDGLPCAEEKIVAKVINKAVEQGSRNYKIIKKLISKGAKIEPTEDPSLLLEEYAQVKAFVEAKSKDIKTKAIKRYEEIKDDLIRKRDEFIAQRINSTLRDGEIGLLFIGAHHNPKSELSKDIIIKDLN